jgi:hypothetical protein
MNDVSWFFDDTLLLKLSFVTSIYIIWRNLTPKPVNSHKLTIWIANF